MTSLTARVTGMSESPVTFGPILVIMPLTCSYPATKGSGPRVPPRVPRPSEGPFCGSTYQGLCCLPDWITTCGAPPVATHSHPASPQVSTRVHVTGDRSGCVSDPPGRVSSDRPGCSYDGRTTHLSRDTGDPRIQGNGPGVVKRKRAKQP